MRGTVAPGLARETAERLGVLAGGQLVLSRPLRGVGVPGVDGLPPSDRAPAAAHARLGHHQGEGVLRPAAAELAVDPHAVLAVALVAHRHAGADLGLRRRAEPELEADAGETPHLSLEFAVAQDGAGRGFGGLVPELGQARFGAFEDEFGVGLRCFGHAVLPSTRRICR